MMSNPEQAILSNSELLKKSKEILSTNYSKSNVAIFFSILGASYFTKFTRIL